MIRTVGDTVDERRRDVPKIFRHMVLRRNIETGHEEKLAVERQGLRGVPR